MKLSALLLLALLSTQGSGSDAVSDSDSACDAESARLAQSVQGKLRYQSRGNRCEGLYQENYATGPRPWGAHPIGVYSTDGELEFGALSTLHVHWDRPAISDSPPITLLAESTKPGKHYRMDARANSKSSFLWPTAVIYDAGLEWMDLGLLASFDSEFRDESVKVYVPLRISTEEQTPQQDVAGRPSYVYVDVKLTHDIRSANVSIRRFDGSTSAWEVRERALIPSLRPNKVARYAIKIKEPADLHLFEFALTLENGTEDGLPSSFKLYCATRSLPLAPEQDQ